LSEKANFSNIYKFYDLINTVLTLGFDKSWREKAVDNLIGTSVLDLGSGTGAAFDQLLNYETTALDPDKKMLELNTFEDKVLGSAENLPFEDNSFDNVFCCFVWRNVSDTNKALQEVYRVLRPGGKFILLDMTRPKNPFLKILHKIGTFKVLHLIGLLTFNLKEYRFLYKSLDFYPQPENHLKKDTFIDLQIERMGLFNFVYLAVFTK
jgi:demethylmenaquinone methyltransferase/2-methoxy-6-polyprenyl-1,4-benzoquinol methylase|tara:strand:- start:996 stop:1619 length:624 start_codon:yes stop_codon:yes gene_type:complete